MLWVVMIRASLTIGAENPESKDNEIYDYAEERDPHVHDK